MSDVHDYLQRLVDESTRSDPLVFAGRKDEIGKVLRSAANPPPQGPRSSTILIQGAPGSGKTSLISRLCSELKIHKDAGVLFLETIPGESAVWRTYGHLASMLIGAGSPTRDGDTQSAIRGGATLGIARGGKTVSRRVSFPTFRSVVDIASERNARWGPMQRVAVFVDEVQEVKPDSAAAAMLQDLHAQTKIPVFLVCAGLSNSDLALSDAGLSRVENKVFLGRLDGQDALDCAQKSLRKVLARGVGGSDVAVERCAAALARASDDWPRHLQVYLQSTWQALLEQESPDLDKVDLKTIIKLGNERRESYYKARIKLSRTPLEVIVALHRRLIDYKVCDESQTRRVIGEAVDKLESRARKEWVARFEDNTEQCFAALLRAGVVALDAREHCVSPVPSFSQFVLESSGGLDRHCH